MKDLQATMAKLRLVEFVLLELLQVVDAGSASTVANGLRARVSQWTCEDNFASLETVDESACQQLVTLLGALRQDYSLPSRVGTRRQNGSAPRPQRA